MALAKKYLLRPSSEFERVRKEGHFFSLPLLGAIVSQKRGKENPSFGFIISRRIDQRATWRNKLRRRLSEAVFHLIPRCPPELEIIFLPRSGLKEKSADAVSQTVEALMIKARLLEK